MYMYMYVCIHVCSYLKWELKVFSLPLSLSPSPSPLPLLSLSFPSSSPSLFLSFLLPLPPRLQVSGFVWRAIRGFWEDWTVRKTWQASSVSAVILLTWRSCSTWLLSCPLTPTTPSRSAACVHACHTKCNYHLFHICQPYGCIVLRWL